jgi:formate dehydrogenase major subunit
VAALGESYGRGAMTNHWIDIRNSDVIMCIGSNAAENHPISFKYVTEAMDKGAKLIVVDPRYTRTAAKASVGNYGSQLYSKMRSGSDIAFINGMMKWAIDNGRINWQYVKDCTNAKFMLNIGFETCRVANPHPAGGNSFGIFSGLVDDPRRHKKYKYDKATWAYQYVAADQPAIDPTGYWDTLPPSGSPDPDSVWAKLIEHLSAYTLANVSDITGACEATLIDVYDTYTSTYLDNKSACIMYAMGSTQHTYGSQNVRSYAMLQLLLGNVGVAGGGINALRGESNVQGSTDMCLLWHILPGYLNVTNNSASMKNRTLYKETYSTGMGSLDITPGNVAVPPGDNTGNPASLSWWKNGPRYIDSMLQAWWPVEITGNLDTSYHYLPKADSTMWYSHT